MKNTKNLLPTTTGETPKDHGPIRKFLGKMVSGDTVDVPVTPSTSSGHELTPAQAAADYAARETRLRRYRDTTRSVEIAEAGKAQARIYRGVSEGNAFVLAQAIPRPVERNGNKAFTGSFPALARTALQQAQQNPDSRHPNGAIELLGSNTEAMLFPRDRPSHVDIMQDSVRAGEYNDGVAALVWQAGFVNYASPDALGDGKGEMNRATIYLRNNGTTSLRIPYNRNNELHQMIAPHADERSGIELEVFEPQGPADNREPYMTIRSVDTENLSTIMMPAIQPSR